MLLNDLYVYIRLRNTMEETHKLKGLATLNFFAADHDTTKRWYAELLGFPLYFERPGYMEFRIGEVLN